MMTHFLRGVSLALFLLLAGDTLAVPVRERGEPLTFTAFRTGRKTFYQVVETRTERTMKVMGQEVLQRQEQTFLLQWTPLEKDGDGNFVARMKVVGMKLKIDIGGNVIDYDSTAPAANMKQPWAALLGATFTYVVSPEPCVVKVSGRGRLAQQIGQANPQILAVVNGVYSDEALAAMVKPLWHGLPPGPVVKGQEWAGQDEVDLGPTGTYRATHRFNYRGKDDGRDRIEVTTRLDFQPPAPPKAAGLPFAIRNVKLSGRGGTGLAHFRPERGCVESCESKCRVEGSLTIAVGAQVTDIILRQETTSSSRVHDEHPWEKK